VLIAYLPSEAADLFLNLVFDLVNIYTLSLQLYMYEGVSKSFRTES
jgi:hypothetical protein